MTVEQILLWATPLIVFAATALVRWLRPALAGWIIVGVVVPAISGILAVITHFLGLLPDQFVVQVILGFLAVFLRELMTQIQQGNQT
jgi:hypothetical protein